MLWVVLERSARVNLSSRRTVEGAAGPSVPAQPSNEESLMLKKILAVLVMLYAVVAFAALRFAARAVPAIAALCG